MWMGLARDEHPILATEIGSGHTAKQVGTEPREFGNFHIYQAWLSTSVWGMQVRGTWGTPWAKSCENEL